MRRLLAVITGVVFSAITGFALYVNAASGDVLCATKLTDAAVLTGSMKSALVAAIIETAPGVNVANLDAVECWKKHTLQTGVEVQQVHCRAFEKCSATVTATEYRDLRLDFALHYAPTATATCRKQLKSILLTTQAQLTAWSTFLTATHNTSLDQVWKWTAYRSTPSDLSIVVSRVMPLQLYTPTEFQLADSTASTRPLIKTCRIVE